MKVIPCTDSAVQGNDSRVDSNDKNGKGIFRRGIT